MAATTALSAPVTTTSTPATVIGAALGGEAPTTASTTKFSGILALLAEVLTAGTAAGTPAQKTPILPVALPGTTPDADLAAAEPLLDCAGAQDGKTEDDDGDDADSELLAMQQMLASAGAPMMLPAQHLAAQSVVTGIESGDADGSGDGLIDADGKGGAQLLAQQDLRGRAGHGGSLQMDAGQLATGAEELAALAGFQRADVTADGAAHPNQNSVSAAQAASAALGQTSAGAQLVAPTNGDVPVVARSIHTPVGQAAWADEIGAKVNLLAGAGVHSASLRLSPEHLGPLEVRISVTDDQASVWFGAQQAETRAALSEAMPRLRELFAAQGMMLADSGVSREAPRQQAPQTRGGFASGNASDDTSGVTTSVTRVTRGLVDTYA